jgi:hypothetical protein
MPRAIWALEVENQVVMCSVSDIGYTVAGQCFVNR